MQLYVLSYGYHIIIALSVDKAIKQALQGNKKHVGEQMYQYFKELCEEKGVTAADVSRATGITECNLSHWKNRPGQSLSLKSLIRLADYFGVSLDRLCRGIKE